MLADQKIEAYFQNIKQVFLYIIDDCNLKCIQCLYKANLQFHVKSKQIELETAKNLLAYFHKLGAVKLTIMGGEPTLYGREDNWIPLLDLIKYSKEIGYEYIRIDTNGTFNEELLYKNDFQQLDEITFSLDGPTVEINDAIRGRGVFEKCSANIRTAIKLGYKCDLTCCIHKMLIQRNTNGELYIDQMILFAQDLGIHTINFHDLFKSGIPRDIWTGEIDISIDEWFDVWEEIQKYINQNRYKIPVRIPQGFTTKEQFEENQEYYGYCSAKLGDRALIHPNGIIRVCSLMIGTPYGIGRYDTERIIWDESYTNELGSHKMAEMTPCTHQSKASCYAPFIPLCVSFKPNQDEFAWNLLQWEKYRRCGNVNSGSDLCK